MATLSEMLTGSLSYDSSWAVYAEKIDGEFKPESPARFGQKVFEDGGLLDDCEKFGANDWIVDQMNDWYGSFELSENIHSAKNEDEQRVEDCLTSLWIEAHDGCEPPSLRNICEWAEDVESYSEYAEYADRVEKLIDFAKEYWHETLDAQEAAQQVIDSVNEGEEY